MAAVADMTATEGGAKMTNGEADGNSNVRLKPTVESTGGGDNDSGESADNP